MAHWLHGFHDRGGEHLHADKPGWTVVTEAIGADPGDSTGRDYRDLSDRGFSVIVRLNHGYGNDGTIPTPDRYGDFARRVGAFVRASQGCTRWIIGNEPNHAQERPNGQPITPAQYAECFARCAQAVRAVGSEHKAILSAIAPWNAEMGDWLAYFVEVCKRTEEYAGGIAMHTYTHGPDPALITSEAKMLPPYAGRRFQFRAYMDFMQVIPPNLRHLPVFITETNQDAPWWDMNNGWVQAAYAEIDAWNRQPDTQKIHCLCLYRWNRDDQWTIEPKTQVQAMFREAVAQGHESPKMGTGATAGSHTVHIPKIEGGSEAAPPKRIWDMRLTERGASVQTPATAGPMWRVIMGRWMPQDEAGGRHHIYVDVLDEQGKRVVGVPLLVNWPGGSARIVTEEKPGDPFSGNYPMTASRNEFSIRVDDGMPSELVTGIGMGAMTPGGFNAGIHTSTILYFQRVAQAARDFDPVSPSSPVPAPGSSTRVQVPPLVHPVRDPTRRMVSQVFGVNPERYARFGLAGHNGVDFAVPVGTPVVAVDDGMVLEVDTDVDGYGLYVKLRHAWGESLYGHLHAIGVGPGDAVFASEVVGLSGNSGNSSGPHLHFGLRVNPYKRGEPFDGYSDPWPYLPQADVAGGPTVPTGDLVGLIRAAAAESGVAVALLASLVWGESSYRVDARSEAGAMGLGQIMPHTWAEWSQKTGASDPWDARDNLRVTAAYLAWLLFEFKGNRGRALAAYNWGFGNVLDGERKMPLETITFVEKVLHGADLLDRWMAGEASP